jgi:hypothetical protein
LTGFLCALIPGLCSGTTIKDVKIGLHVLDFIATPIETQASFGIIFDAHNRESSENAKLINNFLTREAARNQAVPRPLLVDIRQLDAIPPLRAAIIADKMKPYFETLSAFGRRTATVTMSSDLDCVRANKCTIGISSAPKVEIIVSTQQVQASAIQFSDAFRMMVTFY